MFSSRSRHTKSLCDWSSDVCSSDLRSFERVAGFRKAVRQSHPQCFFSMDSSPGENEIERMTVTDQTGQTHRAQIDQRNAEAAAVDAEDRITGSDPQVAPKSEFQAAGHGVAFNGGDDRLAEQPPGGTHRAVRVLWRE